MASSLGLEPPGPTRDGGSNAAHGGSEVLSSDFLQPSLSDQVAEVGSVTATDLNVIWLSSTDLLGAPLSDPPAAELLVFEATAEIRRNVDELYDRGARQFVVLNLPSLAVLPLSTETLNDEESAMLGGLTELFNTELSRQLEDARTTLSSIDVVEFDVHALFAQVLADPDGFGFSNVTDAAAPFDVDALIAGLATGPPPLGVDVDTYLFYDGLHPTARTHEVLGQLVAEAVSVPEPSGLMAWQATWLLAGWVLCRLRLRQKAACY